MKTRWIPEDHYNLILSKMITKDRWLVRLLRATGFRIDDVLHTRRWQWSGKEVSIRERKTQNVRRVPITPEIRRIVEQYEAAAGLKSSRFSAFVPTRRNRPGDRKKLHRTTLWRHFDKAVQSCGLESYGYSLHSLRKCYAVDQFRKKGSLEAVQSDLGHKYLSTTLIYLADAMTLRGD